MILKLKIYFTVLSIYEILVVTLLHFQMMCHAVLPGTFCADSAFKYFIACFAVPVVIFLIVTWIRELVRSIQRRRSFAYKARAAFVDIVSSLKHTVSESVSPQDIEKYITVAILSGVKKYADRHPGLKQTFENILNAVKDQAVNYMSDIPDAPDMHGTPTMKKPAVKKNVKRGSVKSKPIKKKK